MKINEAILLRIKELCDDKNWSTYRLAKESHVPKSTLSSLLNSTTQTPTLPILAKICHGLNMSLEQFFDDSKFDELEEEPRIYEY